MPYCTSIITVYLLQLHLYKGKSLTAFVLVAWRFRISRFQSQLIELLRIQVGGFLFARPAKDGHPLVEALAREMAFINYIALYV